MAFEAAPYAMKLVAEKFGDVVAEDLRSEVETLFAAGDPQNTHTMLCELSSCKSLAEFFLVQYTKEQQRLKQHQQQQPAREPERRRVGSSLFTCPKCRKANAVYTQVQTRSADEPMTNLCRCLECNNRWRE